MYGRDIRMLNKYPEILFYTVMVLCIFAGIVNYRNSGEPFMNFIWWFVVGIVSGIIAVGISVTRYVVMDKTKEKMIELWTNFKIGGMMAFSCACLFEIFLAIGCYKEGGLSEIGKNDEIFVLGALAAVAGLVIFFIGLYKKKMFGK